MEKLNIIKIGGKVIDDEASLYQFLEDFASIEGLKILVHGGGNIASDIGLKMGIKPKMVEGRRITDQETLDLVTMVYGGLVNKKITGQLQSLGTNAIGLTGADGNLIRATKRPVETIDYGFAGDIESKGVNVKLLGQFLSEGLTPVLCPLTHDGNGCLLNTNADTIAAVLSGSLSKKYDTQLVYCFEQKGVLKDQSVIPGINTESYQNLKDQGIITEGMIPKMDNAFDALNAGVDKVRIGHFSDLKSLVVESNSGTLIKS